MEQKKTLDNNSAKKRKILIGCAIGGAAVIVAGAGIGIGYTIWHKKQSGGGDTTTELVYQIEAQNIQTDRNGEMKVTLTNNVNEPLDLTLAGDNSSLFKITYTPSGSNQTEVIICAQNTATLSAQTYHVYLVDQSTQHKTNDIAISVSDVATKSMYLTLSQSTVTVGDQTAYSFTLTPSNFSLSTSLGLNGDAANELNFNGTDNTISLTSDAHAGILSLSITDNTNNVTSNIVTLDITDRVIRNLPMTDDFFTFDPDNNNIITGYAPSFIDSWTSSTQLNMYLASKGATGVNSLCFSNKILADTEYLLSKQRTAYTNINTFYQTLINLDFSYATFDWGDAGGDISTGYFTFGSDSLANSNNFSNVTNIDFQNTNFAPPLAGQTSSVYTAWNTFFNATFTGLTDLDLSGAIFAASGMATSSVVSTACNTFHSATFTGLTDLDLSGAIFTASNMTTAGNINIASHTFDGSTFTGLTDLDLSGAIFAASGMTTNGTVSTAVGTFSNATFTGLTDLDLSSAIFAASNMTTAGNIFTAIDTFARATFTGLTDLDLSGSIFAASGMTANGDVSTALSTFYSATFTKLTDLDLSGAIFAASGMTTNISIKTAFSTFSNADFTSYFTALYLPPDQPDQSWTSTFASITNFSATGTIHWANYSSGTTPNPTNWTASWFNGWTWTNNMT